MEYQYFCWCLGDSTVVYRIHCYTDNVQFYGSNKWLTSCHTPSSFSKVQPAPITITEAKAKLLCRILGTSHESERWFVQIPF